MDEIRIGADDAGQRLDRFLRKYLRGASLPTLYKLIRKKQVTVNGRRSRPETRLAPGDLVVLHPAERRLEDLRGARGERTPGPAPELTVLHEDEHVLAVAKPPFLLVHAGAEKGEATLVDAVLAHLGPADAKTFVPSLAHRLDRLTSGVVLVGKTARGLRGLTEALKRQSVVKVYLALVVGEVGSDRGSIEAPLLREDLYASERPKVRVERKRGKPARTDYRVLARSSGLTLLEVRPRTGRTHQIRVHLRHLGHRVVGDPSYGDRGVNDAMRGRHGLWRQWLHAYSVDLIHPVSGEPLHVRAPLPEDLLRVLDGEGFPRSALPPGAADPLEPAPPSP